MSNTSARPVLPSLQSLAFPSSDRSRANAGSNQDAGVIEFSKLLQKALGAPDAAREVDDAPPEREAVSIETLSIAQGFTALDRPLASESMSSDTAIAPQSPHDGGTSGDDANRFPGGANGERQGDGAASAAPGGTMTPAAAPASPTQPASSDAAEPTMSSKPVSGQAASQASNALANAVPTPNTSSTLPAAPAVAPAPSAATGSEIPIAPSNAAPAPPTDFASLLTATPQEASTPSASAPTTNAPTTSAPTTPGTTKLPAAAATSAGTNAVGTAATANQAPSVPGVALPESAPSGAVMPTTATLDAAKAAAAAATPTAAQNPALAAATTVIAATTPMVSPSPATKSGSPANRSAANEAAIAVATAAETTLATTGGPSVSLAAEATEPTLRGPTHPPAALTAQLTQDPSPVPVTAQPAPSTQGPQPIPLPTPAGAALTDEALEAPVILTEGVDASTAGAEPTGREAMIAANASPVSTEQTVARAQRAAMHPAVAQVAVSVTKAVQEGVDRITIKLQPPELGRIDVRIDVGVDGRIQAVFAAERPATMEILQRDVRELERALQNAGLSTDAGSLSFGLKQQGGGRYTPFAAGMNGDAPAGELDVTGDILVARNAAARRADGHLDIHV